MAAAPPPKRFPRLRETHAKMLLMWRREIDVPQVLATAFPTISASNKKAPEVLQSMFEQFWKEFGANVMVRKRAPPRV